MRKVILKMSVSVDGFVGTTSGGLDWIFPSLSEDAVAWTVDTLWQAGTHIMGRATYLDMAAYWPSSTEAYAAPMNQIPKVVFSRTLKRADWTESRVASGDIREEISRLKQEPGGEILVHGGAGFAQSISSLGLIDEYRLLIHPVVLGNGLRLFANPTSLRLVMAKAFSSGAVAHIYRPA